MCVYVFGCVHLTAGSVTGSSYPQGRIRNRNRSRIIMNGSSIYETFHSVWHLITNIDGSHWIVTSLALNWSCLVTVELSQSLHDTHALVCLQEEYSMEQIQWYPMPLLNRHSCLELISSKPHGILRILDDQTCLPQVQPLFKLDKKNIIKLI